MTCIINIGRREHFKEKIKLPFVEVNVRNKLNVIKVLQTLDILSVVSRDLLIFEPTH